MFSFIIFFSGYIFGMGLLISGMSNPEKVLNFLDLTGKWDPSLAFVMLGALLVSLLAFQYAKKKPRTIYGETIHLPTATRVDWKLVVGSMIFGIGWGLVGFCPGPAIVALGTGQIKAIFFVFIMLVGMLFYDRYFSKWVMNILEPL